MSDFLGLSLLIQRFTSDFDIAKKSLEFTTKWIDTKHRDGGRITAREYQEFLNELKKIENGGEIVPKKIIAWQCVHGCGKYLKTKKSIVDHESSCFWNPARRACASCEFNLREDQTFYNRNHGGDPGSTDYEIKSFYCHALEISLDKPENLKFNCAAWVKK